MTTIAIGPRLRLDAVFDVTKRGLDEYLAKAAPEIGRQPGMSAAESHERIIEEVRKQYVLP